MAATARMRALAGQAQGASRPVYNGVKRQYQPGRAEDDAVDAFTGQKASSNTVTQNLASMRAAKSRVGRNNVTYKRPGV